MAWLTDWIAQCRKGPTKATRDGYNHEMRLMRTSKNRSLFVRITSDPDILLSVTKIYQAVLLDPTRKGDSAAAQTAVKRFLTNACWLPAVIDHVQSTKDQSLSPNRSDTARELQGLGKAAVKLATQIAALKQPLGRGTDLLYLQHRFEAGNPDGFSVNRSGWGRYSQAVFKPKSDLRLQGLLACFAKEAAEVSQLIKAQIKKQREVDGKRAAENSFIDLMLCNAKSLTTARSPTPNFSLIAKIGAHLFVDGLSISTIRKRYKQ